MAPVLSFHQRLNLVLCLLLTISFVLQLIPVLSAPVSKSISLCTYNGYKFGVFGFCKDSFCTGIGIGYKSTDLLPGFALPSNARHSISLLLVVHPLSTAFTFVQIVLSSLLFFDKFNSSTKFQLITLFWTLPTFLLCLLSFLVDMLLFIPHLDWPSWTLLVSTVFLAFCGTMLCVTRRTVSSRRVMRRNFARTGDSEYYSLVAYKSYNGNEYADEMEDYSIDSHEETDSRSLISAGNNNDINTDNGDYVVPQDSLMSHSPTDFEEEPLVRDSVVERSLNPIRAYMRTENGISQAVYFPPKVMALPVESLYDQHGHEPDT